MAYLQNDIDTLLYLYSRFREEEQKLVSNIMENCARYKAGRGFLPWDEIEKKKIVRRFNIAIDTQQSHHDKITEDLMLREIAVSSDMQKRDALKKAYFDVVTGMFVDAINCLKSVVQGIELYLDCCNPATEVLNEIFKRVLWRLECKISIATGDSIKSTLGSEGLDKILVAHGCNSGNVQVTNNDATILKNVGVDNPAAKILVDISRAQELIKEAEKLIEPSCPCQAAPAAHEALQNAGTDNSADFERFLNNLQNTIRKTFSSRILSQDKEHFAQCGMRNAGCS